MCNVQMKTFFIKKERKKNSLVFIEVSMSTICNHVMVIENILRIGGKKKTRTYTLFSSLTLIPATCSCFPSNMDGTSSTLALVMFFTLDLVLSEHLLSCMNFGQNEISYMCFS